MMNRLACAVCVLASLSLAACGSKQTTKVGAEPAKPASTGPASAEQVAKEARGNVSCPATASTQRPAGAPVDDVVGVRPGMPLDEAANFVMCDNPMLVVTEDTSRGYNINTYGQHVRQGFNAAFAQPRVNKSSDQIVKDMEQDALRRSSNTYVPPLEPGQSRYYVSTMGLPGQEQVISVAREEYFVDGKQPTVDSVKQALIGKYGQPSQMDGNGQISYLYWEYDPSGAKMPQGSSRCRINVSPDAATSLSTDCGATIGALVTGANGNPGLAHSLAVTSLNGAQGYALLNGTEAALQKADDARKSKELDNASKNADTPKL